jgi:CheY-like chemotaxis protein
LRRSGAKEDTREWIANLMDRQTRQMARLVDDLLEASRIRQGRIELKREIFYLTQAISVAVESVHAQVESLKQTLTTENDDSQLQMEGDSARIAQILTNLLHNASKYTPQGGRILLTVQIDSVASEVVLRIVDNGIGLDAELLPRVFDLFTQGKRTLDRSEGGLGIGLALVKRLVEMHQGSIAATSKGLGHGTTFTLRLPLHGAYGPAGAGETQDAARIGTETRLRALVVDDNRDVADTLASLLDMEGHALRVAYDGREALEQARAFLPDIAFVDIGLPVHDGYAVARALRADQRTSHVFLVAVSGYAQEEDRRRSAEAGFDLHFAKPVDFEMINGAVLAFIQSAWQGSGDPAAAAP